MQDNFDKINSQTEKLSEYVTLHIPTIIGVFSKSRYKYTSKALMMFITKTGYLSSSIIYLCQTGNLYSSSVLFRSLTEHYFRHLYIYTRALKDNNDSVGINYYKTLKGGEDLESISKINNFNRIINPADTVWKMGGEHNKKISDSAKQFDIKNILIYLINNFKSGELQLPASEEYLKEYLKNRLVEYTNLSSSVHGGPFAEEIINNYHKDKSSKQKDIHNFITQSFGMQKAVVETTFLFAYLLDDKCSEAYNSIKDLSI